jgi:hypothetical protein
MFSHLFFELKIVRSDCATAVFCISPRSARQFARFSHYFSHFRASGIGDWFEWHCVASQSSRGISPFGSLCAPAGENPAIPGLFLRVDRNSGAERLGVERFSLKLPQKISVRPFGGCRRVAMMRSTCAIVLLKYGTREPAMSALCH